MGWLHNSSGPISADCDAADAMASVWASHVLHAAIATAQRAQHMDEPIELMATGPLESWINEPNEHDMTIQRQIGPTQQEKPVPISTSKRIADNR